MNNFLEELTQDDCKEVRGTKPPCSICDSDNFEKCASTPFRVCRAFDSFTLKGTYRKSQIGSWLGRR